MKLKCNYAVSMGTALLCFILLMTGCGSNGSNEGGADTASAVATYKFDENSGSSAINSTQNRYNGVIYGASKVPGKVASAFQFGSAGARIEIPLYPLSVAFPKGEISIDAWVKLDTITLNSFNQIIGNGYSGVKSFCLGVENGQIQFYLHDGSAWRSIVVSNQTLTTNTWHYIAITYNGMSGKIYINGVEDATNTISYPVPTVHNTIYIGASDFDFHISPFAYEFQGVIDEIRIFRTTLSAAEISSYYNLTKNN